MSRYSEHQKLQVVQDYLSGNLGLKEVAERHAVDVSALRSWIPVYREHGVSGLKRKRRVVYVPNSNYPCCKASVTTRCRAAK